MMVPEEEGHRFKFFRREFRDAPEEDSQNFWFDNQRFHEEMKHLQQELHGMGQEIRTKVQGLREKLKRELRQGDPEEVPGALRFTSGMARD